MLKSPIIKPIENSLRKGCFINLNNALHKNLSLSTKVFKDGEDMFVTELKNSNNQLLAKEIFGFMFENTKEFFGFDIKVMQAADKDKGNYWGELLRLISIINMFENKINVFRIYSKETAVYFHSKYKFEPNIRSVEDSYYALKSIADAKNTFLSDMALHAQELVNSIDKDKSSFYCNQNFFDFVNWNVKQYIEEVLKRGKGAYKDFPFLRGFYMKLPKENIEKNSEFFSSLYEKHGIKYDLKA